MVLGGAKEAPAGSGVLVVAGGVAVEGRVLPGDGLAFEHPPLAEHGAGAAGVWGRGWGPFLTTLTDPRGEGSSLRRQKRLLAEKKASG